MTNSSNSNIPQVTPQQATAILTIVLTAPEPVHVLLTGIPGVGKTQIVEQVSRAINLSVWQAIRSSVTLESVDLRGLPFRDGNRTRRSFSDLMPDPDSGATLLFLDELDKASTSVKNGFSDLIEAGRVGDYVLPEGTRIVATANRPQDRTGGTEIPSHLRSRFMVLEVVPSFADWSAWAVSAGSIDPRVVSFLRWSQTTDRERDSFASFDPKRSINPSGRSWEKVSRVLTATPAGTSPEVAHAMHSGIVGPGPATSFSAFLRIASQLPTPEAIAQSPDVAMLPTDSAALHACVSMLAAELKSTNSGPILRYVERIIGSGRAEFAAFFAAEVEQRESPARATSAWINFATSHPEILPS